MKRIRRSNGSEVAPICIKTLPDLPFLRGSLPLKTADLLQKVRGLAPTGQPLRADCGLRPKSGKSRRRSQPSTREICWHSAALGGKDGARRDSRWGYNLWQIRTRRRTLVAGPRADSDAEGFTNARTGGSRQSAKPDSRKTPQMKNKMHRSIVTGSCLALALASWAPVQAQSPEPVPE